jgi:hypothetical protein
MKSMCKICVRIVFLSFLILFINQGILFAGQEDEGYFLSLKQKGQLITYGQIQDDDGIWYNVWICPGYVPPYRYAKKYFYKTGSDFGEYFHTKKYKDLAKDSKDVYRWAFDDCIHDCIIKGVPKAWERYFATAGKRTKKRVFGWWFAYPWAFMESTVESIVRVPVCLTGTVLGTGWGTVGVPAYYITNSSVKGLWDLSVNTITLPVVAGAWNTIISPPMSLVGQKPSLDRVDGFWVRALTNEQVQNMAYADSPVTRDDMVSLGKWGIMLDKELSPYENEYAQVRKEASYAIEKIQYEQREKEKAIDEKESLHVDGLMADPEVQKLMKLLSEKGFTAARLTAMRDDLRESMQENEGIDKMRIYHIISLLIKYPPSNATEKGFRSYKTDPLQRSADIMKNVELPPDKSYEEQGKP